jgi:hypothetical protein
MSAETDQKVVENLSSKFDSNVNLSPDANKNGATTAAPATTTEDVAEKEGLNSNFKKIYTFIK